MKGYTYVLRCADDTLYCGWTNDLTARLAAHNSGKGAKYTRGRGPVTLVYSEMFDTQSEAMQREAAIKKLTRPQKQVLIDSQNGGELLTVYDEDGRACGERPRAGRACAGAVPPCVPPVGGRRAEWRVRSVAAAAAV